MIKAFKFTRHALIKREIEEKLREIHSTGKAIQTWNGKVTINHPVDLPVFSVTSEKLLRAAEVCDYEMDITLKEKTVIIKKDSIKLTLPYSADFQPIEPLKGKKTKIPSNFYDKIKLIAPFVSEDASRGWATTIRIQDGYAYATNNITIVRTPLALPDMTIPIDVIIILLKIKEIPKKVTISHTMIQFNYSKGRWVQGLQMMETWPKFEGLFVIPKKIPKVPETLRESLLKIKHFTYDDTVEIIKNTLTSDEAVIKDITASDCSFSCHHMTKVLESFDRIDLSDKRFIMTGPDIEGVMASTVKI